MTSKWLDCPYCFRMILAVSAGRWKCSGCGATMKQARGRRLFGRTDDTVLNALILSSGCVPPETDR